MVKSILYIFLCFIFSTLPLLAQNTVGLLSYNPAKAFEGYNLLYPHNQASVFLIDNCGQIVNVWTDENPNMRPGNTAYLLENGNIVITKRLNTAVNEPVWAGGGGAIVEIRDWENKLLWRFDYADSFRRLHHDIRPMPNGNVLMISWENKTREEAIQVGRNPDLITQNQVWPDYIIEVDPSNSQIVWEWHAWDHLIQDFDAAKANFGVVADHPELIDFNYDTSDGHPDWMHTNAIDYNAVLDQIVISVPTFDEIWVIDHSTTTAEAAGHTGGKGGRGGDLLYRWGNPAAYRAGDLADRQLFYPHDISWVDNFISPSHPHYGKFSVFNNRIDTKYSTINVFDPAFDSNTWSYPMQNNRWLPLASDIILTHPDTFQINSNGLSSVQLLPNNNILICSGRWGYTFELTPENEIVWEYKTPLSGGSAVSQGTTLDIGTNVTFRMTRYPADYPAFEGKDLAPKGYIEANPDLTFCERVTSLDDPVRNDLLEIYPNPAKSQLVMNWQDINDEKVDIFNALGQKIKSVNINNGSNYLDVTNWQPGVYYIKFSNAVAQKIIIQ